MASNLLFYQLLLAFLVLICVIIHGCRPETDRSSVRG